MELIIQDLHSVVLYQMKINGFRIKEIPTIWSDKEYSKLNLKQAGTKMFLSNIRLRMLYSPAKNFIRLYDKLIDKILK